MIRIFFITSFLTWVFPAFATAQESETRDISGFDEIIVASSATVEVQIAEQFEVVVEGANGSLDDLVTRLDDDTLVIEQNNSDDYLIRLSLPELEVLALVGSGDVLIGDIVGEDLELAVTSSGSLATGTLRLEEIEISLTGSGDLFIAGLEAEQAEISLIGAGDIVIDAIQMEAAEARLLGAGNISISGRIDELELQITGAGNFGGEQLSVGLLEGNIVGSGDANFQQVEDDQLGQGEFDAGDLFTGIGAIDVNSGSRGIRGVRGLREGFGQGEGLIGLLTGLFAVILIFGGPIIIVAVVMIFSYRRKKLLHETLRQFSASEQQVPPEVLDKLLGCSSSPKSNLHNGVVLLAAGLGIGTFLTLVGAGEAAAIGCIPGFIGLAKLAIWKLEEKDRDKAEQESL